jgi:hypothetical protein
VHIGHFVSKHGRVGTPLPDSEGLGLVVGSLIALPNVKDEPRPSLARLVQHQDLDSAASFRTVVR